MESTILSQAKKLYPKGTLFYSATGNLKSPIRVTAIKISEVFKNTIVNAEMGVIYTNGSWAKKV